MSLERKILDTLSRKDYEPLAPSVLAKQLNITKKRAAEFKAVLQTLLRSGQVKKSSGGKLRRPRDAALIRGTVRKIASGAAFLIQLRQPDEPPRPDIYIAAEDLSDAHTGDEVLIQVLKLGPRRDGKPRGRVVEVLTRGTRMFVGVYFEDEGQSYVQVDGTTLNQPVPVGDPGAKGAQPGDKVVFEMLRFPSPSAPGEGVLTQVLGPRGEPGVDTLSIIHEFNLPDEFPEEVLEEARAQAKLFDEEDLQGRLDLTGETIITIDPVDARDFDDAISLERDDKGHWRLGVHIADVAHFVQPGTALDTEAAQRGTSVYLPDRVLPMLPELISNGLASLQPGRVRYTKSVFIDYSPEGVVTNTEFANSAIRSVKRFAYEEVMPLIQHPEHKAHVPARVRQLLNEMFELAMLLRKRRFKAGSLELDMPEVKIDFDKQGRVSGAHVAHHDESHEIIEEFMLAANMAVAVALDDRGIPFLRRVHGDPDETKLRSFAQFVNALGYPLKKYQSRGELQRILHLTKDTKHVHAVHFALLRSLKQAEYSPEVMGHYALAAEHYLHFTSPIRRYPDLTVHRLIDTLAKTGKITKYPGEAELTVTAQHCSRTERRADQAERELTKVKLLTHLADKIGLEMDAVITGAQEWGFFCQGIELPAEGLVPIQSLDDDFYYMDLVTHALIARRSGKRYQLGDRVKVVVARVDVNRRQLEFRLAGSRAAKALQQGGPIDAPRERDTDRRRRRGEDEGRSRRRRR